MAIKRVLHCPKCGYPNVKGKQFRGIYKPGVRCGYCKYLGSDSKEHWDDTRALAGELALEVLVFLNEEGDPYGRCVMCKCSPCARECKIRKALEQKKLADDHKIP